jgi:hypothetical protein
VVSASPNRKGAPCPTLRNRICPAWTLTLLVLLWVCHLLVVKHLLYWTKNHIGHWCLMPVILANWEAEIRRIMVWGQRRQIVWETAHLQNNQSKMCCRWGSSGRGFLC